MSEVLNTATEAFSANFPAEEGGTPPSAPVGGNQPAPSGTPVDQGTPTDQGAQLPPSSQIDVSGLPEEAQIFIRAREREMQADYTRKTQEAAAQRAEAEQAIQFLQALNSDPNFAMQVAAQIQSELQGGFDPYAQGGGQEWYDDDTGEPVGPDPYQMQLAAIAQRQQAIEQEMLTNSMANQMSAQIAHIQQQNPSYTQDDLQSIIDYGWATNGDLLKAAELYQANTDRALARYLESKKSVTTPGTIASTSGAPAANDLAKASHDDVLAAARARIAAELGG